MSDFHYPLGSGRTSPHSYGGERDSEKKEIRLAPRATTTELSSLSAMLPQHCAKLVLGECKMLTLSRERIGSYFGSTGYSWEEILAYALEVYKRKKLRHIKDEAHFLREMGRIEPFHQNALLMADSKRPYQG